MVSAIYICIVNIIQCTNDLYDIIYKVSKGQKTTPDITIATTGWEWIDTRRPLSYCRNIYLNVVDHFRNWKCAFTDKFASPLFIVSFKLRHDGITLPFFALSCSSCDIFTTLSECPLQHESMVLTFCWLNGFSPEYFLPTESYFEIGMAWMGTPPFGLMITVGTINSGGVLNPSPATSLTSFKSFTRASLISRIANLIPMHILGPNPKGMYEAGWISPFCSEEKRLGSNFSGSGQIWGSCWIW